MRLLVFKIHCPSFRFCNPSQSICRGEQLKFNKKKKSISNQVLCSTEHKQLAEEERKEVITSSSSSSAVDDDDEGLQSCLRSGEVTKGDDAERNKKKKVQWVDFVGKPLFDIREFEPSDSETDESEIHAQMTKRSCSLCSIL
ncbi:unnamed protein product [Linum trigynum]|uniref:Uncharacterized protein n=1 Tax=Linum trigynum TaxID=586398 RepID=A0AAV2EK81_9ROSI